MNKSERIVELENQLAESKFNLSALTEEIEEYKKTIANFPTVKQEYDVQVKKLQEQHIKEVSDLNNLLKQTELSVNKRVTEALASIGVAQFAAEEVISVTNTNPRGLYEKFLSLKGPEQTEFYKKHEKEISAFMNAK
jgi:hypothetical protein